MEVGKATQRLYSLSIHPRSPASRKGALRVGGGAWSRERLCWFGV